MARGPHRQRITMPRTERVRLKRLVRKRKAAFALVQRARMILSLRRGNGPAVVAREIGCSARNVRK